MTGRKSRPRLYDDLCAMWQVVSPPENYVEEVATFVARFRRHGLHDGARLLHLGSGGGSVDYHLKRTCSITGVDMSPAMIEYAGRINPDVEYNHGDIRDVRLGRTFDVVLVHDAISYMTTVDELESVYRTAAIHLEAGGLMIALPEELRSRVAVDRADVETHELDGSTVTVIEVDHDEDPDDNEFETVFLFLIRQAGTLRVEVDRHRQGVFELRDFLDAMDRAGFDARAEPWELSDWEPGREMPLITAIRRT